mmetsp:Transcript_22431/g.48822  ORF Transcript_22431/g.48822 Transcript_22431/m.48822 type:complete len:117 (+) Transcript_22431:82-432(+)|eukprot:CAMPEP_0168758064 /NCGR_PEP_ID=MMETSP0724-20121128/21499_1 /TAXON_ID=265536 /ORGANISM="Amphiprora sp., Strain CCMP467" /LENGTH=116 /DNA_ID=CAMNT_0008806913 /DNA_START=62 /DNA_END=412 /DNA_ORIENTATION=+
MVDPRHSGPSKPTDTIATSQLISPRSSQRAMSRPQGLEETTTTTMAVASPSMNLLDALAGNLPSEQMPRIPLAPMLFPGEALQGLSLAELLDSALDDVDDDSIQVEGDHVPRLAPQ